MTYKKLPELITLIDEPNQKGCEHLYIAHHQLFHWAQGSMSKHQDWRGGYVGHIQEVMNIGEELFDTFSEKRELPFSKSDLMLVLYLHDLEKPWKQCMQENFRREYDSYDSDLDFKLAKAKEYNITLTPEHINGIKYVHGEGKDYNPTKRVMNELACMAHAADVMSARIWHKYGKEEDW